MNCARQKEKAQLKKIESFLFQEYSVEVRYGHDLDNAYYESSNLIEINNRQDLRSRVNTLLHEAGHVVLREGDKGMPFSKRFPFLNRSCGTTRRLNKNHRIDVFREEVLAWEKGHSIAGYLCLEIDDAVWNRHRTKALKTYADWI